jgi:hypothetical protein
LRRMRTAKLRASVERIDGSDSRAGAQNRLITLEHALRWRRFGGYHGPNRE